MRTGDRIDKFTNSNDIQWIQMDAIGINSNPTSSLHLNSFREGYSIRTSAYKLSIGQCPRHSNSLTKFSLGQDVSVKTINFEVQRLNRQRRSYFVPHSK